MRWTGTALLALSLMAPTVGGAQVRGMGISPGSRAQLGTGMGAARASSTLAFHGSGTFYQNGFNGFNNHGGFHRFGQFGSRFYPYYYGYYGYPYAYDSSADYGNAPSGYAPGTFDNNAGYPYPQQYAPPPDYYSANQNYVPSSSYAPSGNYSEPGQPAGARPHGITSVNGSEESEVPTVLVFRDGHKLEVSNYAIMGSTLYVLAGPRSRIPIADLDVPATERANDARGTSFRLPESAQE